MKFRIDVLIWLTELQEPSAGQPPENTLGDVHSGAAEVGKASVRIPASGDVLDRQHNVVLVGGTGKTHLAVGLARGWIRDGWPMRSPVWTS